jgi:CRISPR-associated protein Cmr4
VVHDDLFHHLVNSNLEVRTSVVISPVTGAAEPHLLYSYEAIPRAAVLAQEVIEDNYRGTMLPVTQEYDRTIGDRKGNPLGDTWSSPWDVARAGLKLIEILGVGGMGTRGFGRMKLVANWEVTS